MQGFFFEGDKKMNELDQYKIAKEPFYQPQTDEIKMYTAAYMNRMPVMLKGPTGCGKSRFVEYMAYKLDRPLITAVPYKQLTLPTKQPEYI